MSEKAKRRQFGRGYEAGGWARSQKPSPYSFQWAVVRREVMKRDNFQCQLRLPGICIGRAQEADHIVSVADGGEHTLENARAVCKPCHRRRTAQQGGEASKAARERQKEERR